MWFVASSDRTGFYEEAQVPIIELIFNQLRQVPTGSAPKRMQNANF